MVSARSCILDHDSLMLPRETTSVLHRGASGLNLSQQETPNGLIRVRPGESILIGAIFLELIVP